MGVYVWGTGCGASELLEHGAALEMITAFVDSFPAGADFLGKPVILPEMLDVEDCELLIITARHAQAISRRCEQLKIPAEKCLYLKNNATLLDRNDACPAAKRILGEDLLKRLIPKQRVISTPPQLTSQVLPEQELTNDYVRLATLELLCRRVAGLPGAAAELGVYKGFFARCINQLMPERTLYLFDSFQGFAPEDGAGESFQAAHANTAIDRVLSIQPHPETVIVKPGFFPGSLNGLEDRFCLVSLDVDFRQTTLEGLRYFWPRMEKGGYLLLHDWGNPDLPGVSQALEAFEAEIGEKLPAMPLCDVGGSLILCR